MSRHKINTAVLAHARFHPSTYMYRICHKHENMYQLGSQYTKLEEHMSLGTRIKPHSQAQLKQYKNSVDILHEVAIIWCT